MMEFSPKQKALLVMIGIVAGAVLGAQVASFIAENVSPEVITRVIGGTIVGFLFYSMYQLLVSKFEYDEKVEKLVDKK